MNQGKSRQPVDKPWLLFITEQRFLSYREAAGNDDSLAEALYLWNTHVSSALFETLGFLEIALRNAIDSALTESVLLRKVDWLENESSALVENAAVLISQARVRVSRTHRGPPSRDKVISELSFGFWTAFATKRYEKSLWTPRLRHAFPNMNPQRRSVVSERLEKARALRNRIAHHEPIFNRDLESEFEGIIAVLSWMSHDAAKWALKNSRAPLLLANNPIEK